MEEKIELLVAWMNRQYVGFGHPLESQVDELIDVSLAAFEDAEASGLSESKSYMAADRAVVEHILKSDQP